MTLSPIPIITISVIYNKKNTKNNDNNYKNIKWEMNNYKQKIMS